MHGILLFIGQDSWVDLKSKIENLQIITSNQFLFFLKKIVTKSKSEKLTVSTIEQVLRGCECYQTKNPFAPKPIDSEMFKQLRKGIYCEVCHSFHLRVEKHFIQCNSCGLIEAKEKAILRTIHEYGLLNFHSELTTGQLLEFLDYQITEYKLRKILNKYFVRVGKTGGTFYKNKKVSFSIADYSSFNLKR